jgi:hypothetical protein
MRRDVLESPKSHAVMTRSLFEGHLAGGIFCRPNRIPDCLLCVFESGGTSEMESQIRRWRFFS